MKSNKNEETVEDITNLKKKRGLEGAVVTPQVRSALTIGTQIGSRIYAWGSHKLDIVLDRVGVGHIPSLKNPNHHF